MNVIQSDPFIFLDVRREIVAKGAHAFHDGSGLGPSEILAQLLNDSLS